MRHAVLILAFLATPVSAFAACPPPPAAQRDIIADVYYDNPPVNSHINRQKLAKYEAAVGPIEQYLGAVAKMASSGAPDDAQCAVRWLTAWAEGDALLGKIKKEQAYYERKWVLAGLALSYAKVRDAASRDQAASISAWLNTIADKVREHSAAFKGKRNNHYYWEGLAVAATGAATGNQRDLEWGRKVFAYAETRIAADGTLPQEMKRGARALHYHLFAAAPLAMLESILNEDSPKLAMLIDFCMKARAYPNVVTKPARAAQIGVLYDDYDWLAIYARHHDKPEFAVLVGKRKPNVNRLGGALDQPNPLEHPTAR
jgi:poly(beta-D-mannuronate) lyase